MITKFSLENIVRANVSRLKPYSSARDEFKDFAELDMVFLDANENPYENGVNRYPDPQQRNLKEVLADQKRVPAALLACRRRSRTGQTLLRQPIHQ